MYREAALVFNSGYDLNLGLLAAITRPGDAVLFDELVRFYLYYACLLKRSLGMEFVDSLLLR